MIQFIYNLGVTTYGIGVRLAALFGQAKAKKWHHGRKEWRNRLRELIPAGSQPVWVHAASLGEMEQGLPVVEKLKAQFPRQKILITFFSPSGYENFKDHHLADWVFYLPLDTRANARDFVKICQPKMALFIKYEIWVNYFKALGRAKIPLVLAPALFRSGQFYFQPLASSFFKSVFASIEHIMLQNQESYNLLHKMGLRNISICGDTRFDRVLALTRQEYEATNKLESFIGSNFCLVGGSTWPQEENMLLRTLDDFKNLKLILAPHLVDDNNIERLEKTYANYHCEKFSMNTWNPQSRVLIIDNIGQLKKLYRVGDFAFVGGGFGAGVHSTVEPICYGLPVAFGPNHKKFVEPGEMIKKGIGFEINNYRDLKGVLADFLPRDKIYRETQKNIASYVTEKSGAVEKISQKLFEILKAEENN